MKKSLLIFGLLLGPTFVYANLQFTRIHWPLFLNFNPHNVSTDTTFQMRVNHTFKLVQIVSRDPGLNVLIPNMTPEEQDKYVAINSSITFPLSSCTSTSAQDPWEFECTYIEPTKLNIEVKPKCNCNHEGTKKFTIEIRKLKIKSQHFFPANRGGFPPPSEHVKLDVILETAHAKSMNIGPQYMALGYDVEGNTCYDASIELIPNQPIIDE